MRIDIMTDIETLGTGKDVTIIQLAARAFNIATGEFLGDPFKMSVNISDEKNLQIDGATLIWWLKTDKDLLTQILTESEYSKNTIEFVLESFRDWLFMLHGYKEEKYLWGNGILFDNRILQTAMEKYNINYPIFYRNDRDMRTIMDLAALKMGIEPKQLSELFIDTDLKKHDALDDVTFQIRMVSRCYNIIMAN